MLKGILLFALLISFSTSASSNTKLPVNKRSCLKVDNKISYINSKMRAGYSVKQGERFRDDLRNLKKQRDNCKKKKFPTSV